MLNFYDKFKAGMRDEKTSQFIMSWKGWNLTGISNVEVFIASADDNHNG